MRAIPLIAAAIVTLGLSQATAQPKMRDMDPALLTTNAGYDDLSCASRYTLAAFVIHDLDANAATYYAQQASEAGKRYLALHPGESEQSYSSRVTAGAQTLQEKLASNSMTPETLVSEIKHCDQGSTSLSVL